MASDAAISLLCDDLWEVDGHLVEFHRDGTGKLFCVRELSVFIAAETEWKLLSPGSRKAISNTANPSSDAPNAFRGPATFSIEMTLTRRVATLGDSSLEGRQLNEHWLTDEAFSPKTYQLTIESGDFAVDQTFYYEHRLSFEPSPFPPREQWKKPEGYPDAAKIWTVKQFRASLKERPEGLFAQTCAVM